MRANLVLALAFAFLGFILCTLSFLFLNVQIQQEPFSSWSDLPYAGMFHFSGIVCLLAAIIYLLMETRVEVSINTRNLAVISVVVVANFASFILGRYYELTPIFFLIGLVGTSVVSALVALGMGMRELLFLIVVATLIGALDEYAHTSVGTLTYFDNAVPSPLTVSGWSLFTILLITVAKVMTRIRSLNVRDWKILRTVPAIVLAFAISAVAVLQGYGDLFNWLLGAVYLMLVLASVYYTHMHSFRWNLFLMIVSLAFGFAMEYMGRLEGLWTFRFMEPVSLLILFSWPLRIWTVNAGCLLFGIDLSDSLRNQGPTVSAETDNQKSILAVADTHFGLKKKDQACDPIAFSDFLDWIRHLEEKGHEELDLGIWGEKGAHMDLKPPEKIVFLGDILELWDASRDSIDASTRSIVQSISSLSCEKIYVLGNHDYDLVEILGKYPLGLSNVDVVEKEYATEKGGKKLLFLHGHQFDELFTLPSWKVLPHIRRAALTFGLYGWVFVALFVVDLILGIRAGFSRATDNMLLLLLGTISIPFLIIRFGRDVWNSLRTTRHKPRRAEKGFERWLREFRQRKEPSGDWNFVFGHTHAIDFWRKSEGDSVSTVFNIPSWVRDSKVRKRISLENVFRHAFLYIDDRAEEFIAWDTRKKRPFLIPKDIIVERRQAGDLAKLELYGMDQMLQEIGWPPQLIDKWFRYNVADAIAA